jgi:serine/threonine protein kinase
MEAGVMRTLAQHPHILQFYGVSKSPDGLQHLVTEVAPHGSLLDVLVDLEEAGVQALSPTVQLVIAQQVCEAMQALAHAGTSGCMRHVWRAS